MASPIRILLILVLITAGARAQQETGYYTGTIGTHAIAVTLRIGETTSGTYMYVSKGLPIVLEGTRRGEELVLTETDPDNGKVSGTFTVRAAAPYAAITGTWRDAGGKRSLPVTLARVGVMRERVNAKEHAYNFSYEYPEFDATVVPAAAALADTLRAWCEPFLTEFLPESEEELADLREREIDGYEGSITCQVHHVSPTIVSMMLHVYGFTGGAHGWVGYRPMNVDASGAAVRHVRLEEFFRRGSAWRATLSKMCIADLRRQEAQWVLDGELTEKDELLDVFVVSPAALHFVYAPYVAGSWAEGTYTVSIPWKKVEALLDPAGPARLVRGTK